MNSVNAVEERVTAVAVQIGPTPIREQEYRFLSRGLPELKGEQLIDVSHPYFTIKLTFQLDDSINPTDNQIQNNEVSSFQRTNLVSDDAEKVSSSSAVVESKAKRFIGRQSSFRYVEPPNNKEIKEKT